MNGEAAVKATSPDASSVDATLVQVVRGLADSAVVLAADGSTILASSQPFADALGSTPEDVEGRDWRTIQRSAELEAWTERARAQRSAVAFTERRAAHVVEHRITPILSDGVITHFLHVAHEVPLGPRNPVVPRELIDALHGFVGLYTVDGDYLESNRAALARTSSRRGDEVGKKIWELRHWSSSPELEAKVRDAVARAAQGETVRFDTTMSFTDGTSSEMDVSFNPVRNARGDVVQIATSGVDISARKRAERRLQQNESRFRTVVESFPSGVLLVDAAGRIVLANRELLVRFGYEASELLGQPVEVLVPAAARAKHVLDRRVYQGTSEARAMGAGRDLRGTRKDGTSFPVEIGLRPIDMPEGTMTLATVIDITERARAQEELRLHSRVLLGMGEGAHFIDAEGIIRFTNPALDAMFGYERGELLGKPMGVLYDASPEERGGLAEWLMAVLRAEGAWEGELRNRRKDGSVFYSRARIAAISRPDGDLFVSVQEDITERRLSERRIRTSLREKETLLREVHHRVKNNLQVVCSLLSLQRSAVDDASARAMLVDCEERVRIIAMIHEQLYQSGDLGAIDLGGHVGAIAAKMAQAQGGTARLDLECDERLIVPLDSAVPIGFILHELISNALKHAPTAAAGNVHVALKRRGGALSLTVRDNGRGMPPDWRARARGTLGLNLVLALVRQLDGHFDIRNERGAVAEVTLSLPFQ